MIRTSQLVMTVVLLIACDCLVVGQNIGAQRLHRSPVDLAVAHKAGYLLTANEASNSVSLVSIDRRFVVDEIFVGEHPAYVQVAPNEQFAYVSCTYSGDLVKLRLADGKLSEVGRVRVGFEPVGLAVSRNGSRVYVGLTANGTVAEVDSEMLEVLRTFSVGQWPRYLSISNDGARLAIGLSGESRIAVVDLESGKKLYSQYMTGAINIGHLHTSIDGKYVYFPWMVYRDNPITPQFIRLGWVLASRIGRARLDGPAYREAISLDVPGKAVADPHGISMTSDERRMVVSASGTHELLVYRKPDLPFSGSGGPGDLIDRRLLADQDLFYRIELGGRPMGIEYGSDDETIYVANYLNNSVQVVNVEKKEILHEITLGEVPAKDSERLGAELFYDGRKSLDQWYSCHSCHYNGGISARTMDTWNDGSKLTNKTVLPLYEVGKTAPWTWHGWQANLEDAMTKSFTVTMQGEGVTKKQANDVINYLNSLKRPQNPYRQKNGDLSQAAVRGKVVFESDHAGCIQCHNGEHFTDGEVHDVGTGDEEDAYQGFNTPSLVGVYRKVRLLHDGRVKSLQDVLTDEHSPENVAGTRELEPNELEDLIEYLRSL